jgi:hypothetical protein
MICIFLFINTKLPESHPYTKIELCWAIIVKPAKYKFTMISSITNI